MKTFLKYSNTSLQIGFYKKVWDLASGNAVPISSTISRKVHDFLAMTYSVPYACRNSLRTVKYYVLVACYPSLDRFTQKTIFLIIQDHRCKYQPSQCPLATATDEHVDVVLRSRMP